METPVSGQEMFPPPGTDTTQTLAAAFSGGGVPSPNFAAAATGEALPPTAADTQQQTQSLQPPAPVLHFSANPSHRSLPFHIQD